MFRKHTREHQDMMKSFLILSENGKPGGLVHIHNASDGSELTEKEIQVVLKQASLSVRRL